MKTLIAALLLVPSLCWGQLAQLSSAVDQRPATTDPTVVRMEVTDEIHNMTSLGDGVRVHTWGRYLIIAAPQVGRLKGGDQESFRCWIRVNGHDVANSNVLLALGQGTKDVIVSQSLITLYAGDKVQVVMAVSDPKDGVGIEAILPPENVLVPSIIFSIARIQGEPKG
jgi:hypothetical protein